MAANGKRIKKVERKDVSLHGIVHVLLLQERGRWFAQGLEVDYFAEGEDRQEVEANFQEGFIETLCTHLKVYGNLNLFLQIAPTAYWDMYLRRVLASQTAPVPVPVATATAAPWLQFHTMSEQYA